MSANLFAELTAPNGRKFTQPLGLFIDNEWVAAKSGELIETIYPADESVIAKVHAAGQDDVDDAVRAARRAFNGPWRDVTPTQRGALLNKFANLVEQHRETLATIETWDNGKPYSASLSGDVEEVLAVTRYYAGYADKNFGQVIDTKPDQLNYTIQEPKGVCGQIVPWNYPMGMASWKFAPALAAGNTIVLKAAEQTPLSALYLANLFKEAGFPPGVVNIVNGYGRVAGAAIASHLDIDKIAFTGSTATGREIMKAAAANLKDITLETGGKSPSIIFGDADLLNAVKWTHYGIMGNSGQICTANSRIFVHASIYDNFLATFKEKISSTSILGDPFKDDTYQGPQVSKAQYDRILSLVESGKSQGANLYIGGEPLDANGKGFFIKPTIFTNVKPDMDIYREEIFGPVGVVVPFETEEEVIKMANDTIYGLGAAVFTKDISRAHRVAKKIESGNVWINSSQNSDTRIPFGGHKQSGIGRECGEAGIKAYTTTKSVLVNLGA
ncbi:aldehyde dehydrogenase domain-containing protein [Pyrenochaeta sp. MPI-SDFR-AT-0127]|nr:aldehyde dehydrogenase domain-containing protein [Pyrenochaeta sp. MPI-SDFR-AT-0127]